MRWKYKTWQPWQLNETRVWFAWYPVVVGDKLVWLEYVSKTLIGWHNDMDGSTRVYEYGEVGKEAP